MNSDISSLILGYLIKPVFELDDWAKNAFGHKIFQFKKSHWDMLCVNRGAIGLIKHKLKTNPSIIDIKKFNRNPNAIRYLISHPDKISLDDLVYNMGNIRPLLELFDTNNRILYIIFSGECRMMDKVSENQGLIDYLYNKYYLSGKLTETELSMIPVDKLALNPSNSALKLCDDLLVLVFGMASCIWEKCKRNLIKNPNPLAAKILKKYNMQPSNDNIWECSLPEYDSQLIDACDYIVDENMSGYIPANILANQNPKIIEWIWNNANIFKNRPEEDIIRHLFRNPNPCARILFRKIGLELRGLNIGNLVHSLNLPNSIDYIIANADLICSNIDTLVFHTILSNPEIFKLVTPRKLIKKLSRAQLG